VDGRASVTKDAAFQHRSRTPCLDYACMNDALQLCLLHVLGCSVAVMRRDAFSITTVMTIHTVIKTTVFEDKQNSGQGIRCN